MCDESNVNSRNVIRTRTVESKLLILLFSAFIYGIQIFTFLLQK